MYDIAMDDYDDELEDLEDGLEDEEPEDDSDELDEGRLFDLEEKGIFDAQLENDMGYSDFREYGASVDYFDDLSEEEKDAYDRGYYGAK